MRSIGIIVCADTKVGLGHLRRSLMLAKHLQKAEPNFVFSFLNARLTECNAKGIASSLNVEVNDYFTSSELIKELESFDVIICDLVIRKNYQSQSFFTDISSYLSSRSDTVIVVDGLGSTNLSIETFKGKYLAVIQPYFYDLEAQTNLHCKNYFGGPSYALIEPASINYHPSKTVINILISAGATLDFETALELIKILPKNEQKFNIEVAVYDHSKEFLHETGMLKITTVSFDTLGLVNLAKRFDFVITGAGQSRYELAEANIPFAFFDWSKETKQASILFEKHMNGRCIYLGLLADLRQAELSSADLANFVSNFNKVDLPFKFASKFSFQKIANVISSVAFRGNCE